MVSADQVSAEANREDAGERHALVTGVSSGIGAAIATQLLDQGWHVTGVSRSAPAISHERLRFCPVDLRDGEAVATFAAQLPPLSVFVHAAGFMRVGHLGDLDPAAGREMWRVHVDAAAILASHIAPLMSGQGRIVLIGSRTSSGAAGRSQYAATKAALVGLARSWAIELAPRGITVNVVAPGATETAMLNDPSRQAVRPRLPPIGRFVQPDEVAALVMFLVSDAAGAITGQQIMICGGASL